MRRLLLLVSAFCVSAIIAAPKATINEIKLDYKTYGFSDPNPVPTPHWQMYPYFRFAGFDKDAKKKTWNVVRLENKYIYVDVFPEIGGKVWTAHDKVNDKDFLYNNRVVKFRDIAMRGAWTSGGIEFNFGLIGHQPTVSTPIDYVTRCNPDGSVSCFVSSYEFMNGSFWSVEINVPADKAYFRTSVTWHNISSSEVSSYQWMNAAYKARGKAEYIFPGNAFIGHGTELDSWPIDSKGHDLRFYDDYEKFSGDASEHVLGYLGDFYGVYYHKDAFGTVHHAPYDAKLGQKIFLWSSARDGAIWEDLLTDNDGQYVELQSGRLFNQPAHSKLSSYKNSGIAPLMTDCWDEYWFPTAAIGGFDKASKFGAIRVEREKGDLQLSFSALSSGSRTVKIYDDEKLVKEYTASFEVLKPKFETIKGLASIPVGSLVIEIGDDELVYSERKRDFELSRPKKSTYDYQSVFGLYAMGVQELLEKRWGDSERSFKKVLEMNPEYIPAHTKLASVYVRRGMYEKAIPHLDKAVAFDAYDAEANFVRAVASRALGRIADAKDGFSLATRSGEYRTAAFAYLAELYLSEGRLARAEEYALRALEYNVRNLDARQVLAVVYRKRNEVKAANAQIAAALETAPLWHPARAEAAFLTGGDFAGQFCSLIRNELPKETCMEVGSWYVRLGLLDEADSVFACAPSYPLAVMYRAWIAEQKGQCDDSRRLLAEALKLDPRWVLPFRPQSLKMLAWADSRSDDPKIDYYRGLILWRNIRFEEALAEFEKIGEFDFAPFFQARAELCKLLKKPYRADLERALAMEPSWRIYGALMDEAESRCAWNESIRYGEEGYAKFPECFTLALKLAGAYRSDGQYRKAIDLLEKVVVMPAEGSWLGRYIWRLANIQYAVELANSGKVDEASKYLANSYQWRETLGSGKPQDFRIDLRVEHFAEAMIAGKRGDLAARKKWLEKIAAITPSATFKSREVIIAFALRELGKKDQAEQLISKWRTQNGNRKNDLLDCCLALYNGDYDTVRKLLVPAPKEDNVAVWHAPVRDTDMHIIVKIVMP